MKHVNKERRIDVNTKKLITCNLIGPSQGLFHRINLINGLFPPDDFLMFSFFQFDIGNNNFSIAAYPIRDAPISFRSRTGRGYRYHTNCRCQHELTLKIQVLWVTGWDKTCQSQAVYHHSAYLKTTQHCFKLSCT